MKHEATLDRFCENLNIMNDFSESPGLEASLSGPSE